MGIGFHGSNGISPQSSLNIYRIYVVPRMMYGLEAVTLTAKQIQDLEDYHRKTTRDLQTLPTRVASCVVYLLAGMLPLEALLDMQLVVLLIATTKSEALKTCGLHQLSCKNGNSSSWFVYSAKRLQVYNLDALEIILCKTSLRSAKNAISNHWTSLLQKEAALKSTLRFLECESCSLRKPHPVWISAGCNSAEIRKAVQKVRLLSGTYLLQAGKAVFNQYQVDPNCPLCKSEPEDRAHFLLRCSAFDLIRGKYLPDIISLVPQFGELEVDDQIRTLLDYNFAKKVSCDTDRLELVTRAYVYSLHCKRINFLNLFRPNLAFDACGDETCM
jgi:hypothetical protein